MTRTPLSRSKGHQTALLTTVLARQAAAAVGVRTSWPWETTATLRLLGGARDPRAPTGEDRGGAYRGGRPPTASLLRLHCSSSPRTRVGGAYGHHAGRRMVVARSNCSRMGVVTSALAQNAAGRQRSQHPPSPPPPHWSADVATDRCVYCLHCAIAMRRLIIRTDRHQRAAVTSARCRL